MSTPGLYTPGTSWLYRLDPRVKLAMTLGGILAILWFGRLEVLLSVLVLAHLVLLTGRVPVRALLGSWRALTPILLIVLILQPIFASGDGSALLTLGPMRITEYGLLLALRYALRVASAAFLVFIPILTTPLNRLVRAFEKLGLPYTWSMVIGLALQYMGTVGDLYGGIREAQQARGLVAKKRGIRARAESVVPTVVALIIAALRLSDSLALALAARGFGMPARGPRPVLYDLAMRPVDWAVLVVMIGVMVGVVAAF